MYVVIDRASKNVMGEFDSFAQAEAMLLDLVGAHPQAATEIEIVSGKGDRKPVAADKLRDAVWRHAPVRA